MFDKLDMAKMHWAVHLNFTCVVMLKCFQSGCIGIEQVAVSIEHERVEGVSAVDGSHPQVCGAGIQLSYVQNGSLYMARRRLHLDCLYTQSCSVSAATHIERQPTPQVPNYRQGDTRLAAQTALACMRFMEHQARSG